MRSIRLQKTLLIISINALALFLVGCPNEEMPDSNPCHIVESECIGKLYEECRCHAFKIIDKDHLIYAEDIGQDKTNLKRLVDIHADYPSPSGQFPKLLQYTRDVKATYDNQGN